MVGGWRTRGGGGWRRRVLAMSIAALVAVGCAGGPPDEVRTVPPTTGASPAAASPTRAGDATPGETTADVTGATATTPREPTTPSPGTAASPTTAADPHPVATFDVAAVPEASGLARSRRDDEVLWVLDDGPGTGGLVAVRVGGGEIGTVGIAGLDGTDTEALAAGNCAPDDDRTCLFVGDIGDNLASRASVRIHRVVEPDVGDGAPAGPLEADVVELTYPDGPRDAEAMFAQDGRLFVVSKAPFDREEGTTGATRLYEAPVFADGEFLAHGVVPVPRPRTALASGVVGNVVTGADAVPGRVVLRTYDHAVVYTAPHDNGPDPASSDPSAMGRWPFAEVPTQGPLQTEGIAFAADGCTTFTVGEGSGAVWRIPCP